MRNRLLGCLLGASALCSSALAYTPTPEEIKADNLKNKTPLETLDSARNNWKAVLIGVDGVKEFSKEDYALTTYGKPWSFDNEFESGVKGKLNLSDFKVQDDVMSFTTKSDAELFWGDHYGNKPEYGEESIGKAWWGHWHPMWLKIRLKQSLPESSGVLSLRLTGGEHIWRHHFDFKLKGTDWQTLVLNLGDSRASYASFSLLFSDPGNKIEISAMNVFTKRLSRVYEKTIEVKDDVEKASFCLMTAPSFKVYVNGELACEAEQGSRMEGMLNRYENMGKLFHKGKNVIRVEAEVANWSHDNDALLFDGAVYDKAGNVYRLSSDASWLGRYATAKDGDAAFKPVRLMGAMKAHYGSEEKGVRSYGGTYFLECPDYGKLQAAPAGRKLPIFRPGEKLAFDVEVFGKGVEGKFDVSAKIMDAMEHDKLVAELPLLKGVEPSKVKAPLSFVAPKPGVYDVEVSLKDSASGTQLDKIVFEAVSVGKIEQREVLGSDYKEGLDLKLVDSFDFTGKDDRPFVNCANDGTDFKGRVVEKPFGKYLESKPDMYSFMSVKVETPDNDGPYLLEIDYPDDADRVIGVSLGCKSHNEAICNDAGGREWPCGVSGVYTGFGNKLTNSMRTLRMVVYPALRQGTVDIVNAYNGNPAAVSALRLYKITNDIPALKVFGKRDRLTGIHSERIDILATTYYNGDVGLAFGGHLCTYPFHGFYKAWYITTSNLVKDMRFCGENMLIAGMQMYGDGYFYPSSVPGDMKTKAAQADCAALVGEMFAANGLSLLLGVEFSNTAELRLKSRVSNQAVAAGEHSYYNVTRDGRQIATWDRVANIVEPEIKKGLYDVIDDLCRLYKDNPGVKGFFVQEGVGFNPCFPCNSAQKIFDPLEVGYDDLTIAQFEKDCGLSIPVAKTGKERFQKRYDWLMANAKDKWVAWRCEVIYEANKEIAKRVKAANPAWTLCLKNIQPMAMLKGSTYTIDSLQRAMAFYPPMYKDSVFCVGRDYVESIRHKQTGDDDFVMNQVWNESDETAALFASGNGKTCFQTGAQFFEPSLNRKPGTWYWTSTLNGSYCSAADDELNRLYNRLLIRDTPQVIAQFWTDMNLASGNEQQRRLFNRAFTVIPEGSYKTLRGDGLDANVVVRASKGAFYIVNPLPFEMELTLKSEGASKIVDLATGETFEVKDGVSKVKLARYSLRTFAFERAGFLSFFRGASLTGMESEVPPEFAKSCEVRAGEMAGIAQTLSAKLKDKAGSGDAAAFISLAKKLEDCIAGKRYGAASQLLDGYTLKHLKSEVMDLANPINWKIVGPFPNPKREFFEKAHPVEKDLLSGTLESSYEGIDGKRVSWQGVNAASSGSARGIVDLMELYGGKPCSFQVAYAYTYVHVDADVEAKILIGSDDGLKIWVNGAQVFSIKPAGRGLVPGEDSATCKLKKGWNVIVLKAENNIGGWGFAVDFKTLDGQDIPSLEYGAPEKGAK